MRKFCSFVVAGLLTLLVSESALAQNPDNQWLIGVGAHAIDFRAVDPIFSQFFKTANWEVTPPLSRIWVARSLMPRLNVQASASVGEIDNNRWGFNDEFFLDADAGIQFRIGNDKGIFKVFDPYLAVNLGYSNLDYSGAKYGLGGNEYIYTDLKDTKRPLVKSTYQEKTKNFISAAGGLGFNLWFTDKFGINYQGQYKHMLNGKSNYEDYFLHSFGFVFRFGSKDTDKDGIIDKKDACPEVPGLAKYDGCPDSDGDGIIDSKDSCPNKAGLERFNGCPDSDNDGIPDRDDKCPNQAGTRANGGCPVIDSDGDGIPDERDHCPDKPGVVAQHGCPEVPKESVEQINERLSNIYFDFAKYGIKPEMSAILDDVAHFIGYHDTYKFRVEGHADSIGSIKANQRISDERAQAVTDYLYAQGVHPGQLIPKGYGETKPVASNKTKEGRAKNRRVEIKVAE